MRILVCGGRDFTDAQLLDNTLDKLQQELGPEDEVEVLIHGCARGADHIAEGWAILNGIPVIGIAADWRLHGRRAGPIRNQRMLIEGKPDLVIAFPGGRGTADMVNRAKRAGVEVRVVSLTPPPSKT